MIAALPTYYNGVNFRSRLEAKWAIFFDLSKLDWVYEPEAFKCDFGNYCPDFLISDTHYAEVKPNCAAWNSANHMNGFVKITNMPLLACVGSPHNKVATFYPDKDSGFTIISESKKADFAAKCRFDNGQLSEDSIRLAYKLFRISLYHG